MRTQGTWGTGDGHRSSTAVAAGGRPWPAAPACGSPAHRLRRHTIPLGRTATLSPQACADVRPALVEAGPRSTS